jgi:glycosyltransferase involved in cell wall biosynthesis
MPRPNTASVIIPTFRRPELLRRLLSSLAAQRTDYRFEVIAVNDAPGDDLSSMELEFSDISVRILNLTEDHGRSVARNTGVSNSTGEILIFLDDDMSVVEGFVASHMEMHTDPKAAVVGNIFSDPRYSSDPLARYIERQGAKKRRSGEELPPRVFRTGNASVSRAMFDKAGMFDEDLKTYGEDLDLAMRLSYEGAHFVYAEGAISYHHYVPDLEDFLAKLREWGYHTLPLHAEKHPELAKAVWLHLAEPVRFGGENPALSLKKVALRILLTPPFYYLAAAAYRAKWLGRLLFPVIDFMRLYTYLRAYREAVR